MSEIPVLIPLDEREETNITKRMAPLFEILETKKSLKIVYKRKKPEQIDMTPLGILSHVGVEYYKNTRHTYYCTECNNLELNSRKLYLEHLFNTHNYNYGPHIVTCKQAH